MLPLIFDVGKIARRNKQCVGRLIPGFFLFCTSSFDCCAIRLEVDFRNRPFLFLDSFRQLQSPYYILQFLFLTGYALFIRSIDFNNSYLLAKVRITAYNKYKINLREEMRCLNIPPPRKQRKNGASQNAGCRSCSKKISHTGDKTWPDMVDSEKYRKTIWPKIEGTQRRCKRKY